MYTVGQLCVDRSQTTHRIGKKGADKSFCLDTVPRRGAVVRAICIFLDRASISSVNGETFARSNSFSRIT